MDLALMITGIVLLASRGGPARIVFGVTLTVIGTAWFCIGFILGFVGALP